MKYAVSLILMMLTISALLMSPAMAGERNSVWVLSAHEDNFYQQYGGRVFRFVCGKRQVFVFKRADGEKGFFNCRGRRTSPNAYMVTRKGRRWKRAR